MAYRLPLFLKKFTIMKKILLSSIALVVIAISANAQGFALGAKLGSIGTKIDGESFESGYKLSYQGGAFLELDLTNTWGIQPELLFSQLSAKTTSGLTVGSITSGLQPNTLFKLSYLNVPILLRYNFAKIFTLNAGPQYGILLNKGVTLKDNAVSAVTSGDLSGVVGLQVHLIGLRVYGRYVFGLNNISDAVKSENWKSQQLELGVGFKLL